MRLNLIIGSICVGLLYGFWEVGVVLPSEKIFSGLLVLVLILIFLLKNTEEVAIDLIFVRYDQVKIAFVMVGALAVGILIGYGVAVTSIISAKSEIRSFKLKNRRLSDELNDLRNVAIDEGIYDNDVGED